MAPPNRFCVAMIFLNSYLGFEHDSTSVKMIDLETKMMDKFHGKTSSKLDGEKC